MTTDALQLAYWRPPAHHGKRHPLIRLAQKRLEDYRDAPEKLPSLSMCPVPIRTGGGGLKDRLRGMYYQRRMACIVLLQAWLQHVDLVTLLGGVANGRYVGIKLDTLAENTGMGRRRLDRAMRDLKTAGIVSSIERAEYEADAGRWKGHTAIRIVAADLFGALGLAGRLQKARSALYKKRGHRGSPVKESRAASRAMLLMRKLGMPPEKALSHARNELANQSPAARTLGSFQRTKPPP